MKSNNQKIFSKFRGRKYIGAKCPILSLVRIITGNTIGEISYPMIDDYPALEDCTNMGDMQIERKIYLPKDKR